MWMGHGKLTLSRRCEGFGSDEVRGWLAGWLVCFVVCNSWRVGVIVSVIDSVLVGVIIFYKVCLYFFIFLTL